MWSQLELVKVRHIYWQSDSFILIVKFCMTVDNVFQITGDLEITRLLPQ